MEQVLLLCAAGLSGCCAVICLLPSQSRQRERIAALLWSLSSILILIVTLLLISYQVTSRFEYQYVYSHTSRDTALIYRISALWSGQEGSFLLWCLISCIMGIPLLRSSCEKFNKALGIYAVINLCIIIMCCITQPFIKMTSVPNDGAGLTEALKDPWMVIHPPLVFLSYSAMAVLFSLSAASANRAQSMMTDRMITWQRISWFTLGIGILTGSVWAYRALGWGGYWSWDPIENAALVPWLVLCAILHQGNGMNRLVGLIPFPIACFGVFLARSGVLENLSSHAYTQGNIVITVILLCFVVSILLYLVYSLSRRRKRRTPLDDEHRYRNRKIISCVILCYAALILLGTVAPILLHVQVPIPYYTVISIIFVLMYSGYLLVWNWQELIQQNIRMIAVSTILVITIIALTRSVSIWWLLLLWVCLMPPALWLVSGLRLNHWRFYLSHFGVILLVIGAVCSCGLCRQAYVIINPSDSTVKIESASVAVEQLIENDVLIKSQPTGDIIIDCSGISSKTYDTVAVPYVTRPLIILFWVGGLILIGQPCISLLIQLLSGMREKQTSS